MKQILIFCIISTFLLGNDKGFIYGKITMANGKEYKGAIRWGKGYGKEHFWMDSFNANKIENEYEHIVDPRDVRKKRKRHFFGFFTRSSRDYLPNHQFVCYFGDIKKIIPRSKSSAEIVLKNNSVYEVKSSDAGKTIYILDEDTGDEEELSWRRIDEIEFMETPEKLKYSFGKAIYGEVETEIGTFKGLIQWDYDESLTNEELEGDDDEFRFSEIKTIEKVNRRGVRVILENGRDYKLSGTNDVDDDNRGIVIKTEDIGTIVINWREFESVTFDDSKNSGPGYSEFMEAKKLYGKVYMNGEVLKGRIVYDLDETYDIEFLEGEDDRVEFNIPFRNIASIEVLERDACKVTLKSGKELRLYDRRDVSDENDGLLVWTNESEEPTYVRWSKVDKIVFDK